VGTSKNQPSPKTPNWRAAHLAYSDPTISLDRAVQEIWRAATNQPSGDLAHSLRQPAVAECWAVASEARSREGAVDLVSRHIASLGRTSLALVIAQRAIAQSFGQPNPVASFASCLFAEAGNYLVSRDLPGFVGATGRATTITEATSLKAQIRDRIGARTAEDKAPTKAALADSWADYVTQVVSHLREARREE